MSDINRKTDQKRKTVNEKTSSRRLSNKSKAIIGVVIALVVVLIIVLAAVKNMNKNNEPEVLIEETEDTGMNTEKIHISSVRHISFSQLSVKKVDGFIQVDEFRTMLQTLYDQNYVLIDIYSLVDIDESGNMSMKDTIDVPSGKRPLILSQRDVSYPVKRQGPDFAKRLVIDADGHIRCEYTDELGNGSIGNFDFIPVLESFIAEHPEFSYKGAKGIIGITGYNGVLGYRTSSYLGSEAGNPYGVFDTKSETSAVSGVIDILSANGWHFACNGFGNISFGSEYSIVEEDVNKWKEQVEPVIGKTDLLVFPRSTDIASWVPYSHENKKFALLKNNGFSYFMVNETDTPGFIQVEDDYFRQAIYEVNTIVEFQNAIAD